MLDALPETADMATKLSSSGALAIGRGLTTVFGFCEALTLRSMVMAPNGGWTVQAVLTIDSSDDDHKRFEVRIAVSCISELGCRSANHFYFLAEAYSTLDRCRSIAQPPAGMLSWET